MNNKDWFEQMELALFHAKKSYEKFEKGIEEEKREDISIWFGFPEMSKNKQFQDLLDKEIITYEDSQEVELVINY